ncbi:membrane protein [Cellulomonas carbonis T26]|uniref:Membrane protein n=1 Tax=Cellulomonas carbonis T26 TaxID=947969 RepID=A0A0A0BR00_9CELL|nr:membrane protein [Cellulomonas carbonis T26]
MPAATPVLALGPQWLDPDAILHWLGPLAVVGVLAIVFAETGLLVGFFLPGDSLLFTAGMLTATGFIDVPVLLLCALVFAAAFAGDQTGYLIGRSAGPRVFRRPDSRVFRQEYVDRTYAWFERYGGRTVVLARFVPVVRTFAPVAAGVGGMRYRTFVTYNLVGALLWGVGVTLVGFWLGQVAFVQENIEAILIGIVAVSVVPVVVELLRGRAGGRRDTGMSAPTERTPHV